MTGDRYIVYHGHREHSGGPNTVIRIDPATGPVALDPRLDIRNHSPTGFEWGYGGSGPAQLALALCVDALDGEEPRARRIYQHVKWTLVAHFDREDWTVTRDEIRALIERIEAEITLPPELTRCAICGATIETAELCADCAKNNDPFFTTKYRA